MRIEEGKIYRTRSGQKVGPMIDLRAANGGGPFIIEGTVDLVWETDGRGACDNSGTDLVAEWSDDEDPDFAEVEVAQNRQLKVEAGKLYVDADGFVHGPVEVFSPLPDGRYPVYAGSNWWWGDGSTKAHGGAALVSEWVPPFPRHAAEENERLRVVLAEAERDRDYFSSALSEAAHHLGVASKNLTPKEHADAVFAAIDRLKHEAEMHRDAALDAVADMKQAEARLDQLAVPHSFYFDGTVAAVFVPKAKLQEFSSACSDLACWMQGFVTALSPDDRLHYAPLGQYVVTELNLVLKAAIDRVEAAEKKS